VNGLYMIKPSAIPGGFPSTLNYPENLPIIYREHSLWPVDRGW